LNSPRQLRDRYDVVIIGGALAGASTAVLLLREKPDLRVLIVEKSAAFNRRVGEATVEVSCYFLCKLLGLTQYLNEAHIVKHGMRFWFYNDETKTIAECGELGGRYLSRVPAFQVDRSRLDEEVIRRAQEAGAEVLRPASIGKVTLHEGGDQEIEVRAGEEARTLRGRWVVDASGVAAVLARQNGWFKANQAHPTTAVWARWTGVKDFDGLELRAMYPDWAKRCHGIRHTATNHFVGPGWWAWVIPLKGGDVSVGIVFDQRFVDWPSEGSLADRLKTFLLKHPAGRELLCDARCVEGDVHWRKNLPYCSSKFAGDGFIIIGDAGAFLDPFYSPGMDWVTYTSYTATRLILEKFQPDSQKEKTKISVADEAKRINATFTRSYNRWFEAIYRNKYEYMSEFDLMRLAFIMDVGLYYMGVVSQPFLRGNDALLEPYYSTAGSVPFYHLMRTYNRRFAAIARERRRRGKAGRRNHCSHDLVGGFSFAPATAIPILKCLARWMRIEITEGWRTWFRREEKTPIFETQAEQIANPGMAAPAAALAK
jgi:flavin-dependent dehydrogenase